MPELSVAQLDEFRQLRLLTEQIESEVRAVEPDVVLFGVKASRLPNTIALSMPGISNETQVIYFDINSFAVSAGSACSSGRVELPYILMSMGYSEEVARTTIRVSLGLENTIEEVKRFVNLWKGLYLKTNALAA